MIFYCFYTIPITIRENIKKQENKNKKNPSQIKNNTTSPFKKNVLPTENEKIIIYNEEIPVKFNQSFPQNREQIEEIRITKTEKNNNKEIYSTKICTLCGYIYLRRKTDKKQTCFCHYYTGKCTWFCEKICNVDVILIFFILLYCQVIIMGFNQILKEKLFSEYSYTKNIKFYCALFILSLFFGVIIIYKFCYLTKEEEKENKSNKDIKDCYQCKSCHLFDRSFVFMIVFIIFTFISSICYYTDNNLDRERWNNIIMAEFIFFKIIDFQILTFFNFYDNSDLFNTTLAITFEKLLWMIIETIIDSFVETKKSLITVQIILTSIFVAIFSIFIFIFVLSLCLCPSKNSKK